MKFTEYIKEKKSKLYNELFQIIAISNNKKEINNCINMVEKAMKNKSINSVEYKSLKKEIELSIKSKL